MTPATGTTKLAANADSSSGVGATPAGPAVFGVGLGVTIARAVSTGRTAAPTRALPFDALPFDALPFDAAVLAAAGSLAGREAESSTAPLTCASAPVVAPLDSAPADG